MIGSLAWQTAPLSEVFLLQEPEPAKDEDEEMPSFVSSENFSTDNEKALFLNSAEGLQDVTSVQEDKADPFRINRSVPICTCNFRNLKMPPNNNSFLTATTRW